MTIVRSVMNRTAGRAGARKVNDSLPENAFLSRVLATEKTLPTRKQTTEEALALLIAPIHVVKKMLPDQRIGETILLTTANLSVQSEVETRGIHESAGIQIIQEATVPLMKIVVAKKATTVQRIAETIPPTIANPSAQSETVKSDQGVIMGIQITQEALDLAKKPAAAKKATTAERIAEAIPPTIANLSAQSDKANSGQKMIAIPPITVAKTALETKEGLSTKTAGEKTIPTDLVLKAKGKSGLKMTIGLETDETVNMPTSASPSPKEAVDLKEKIARAATRAKMAACASTNSWLMQAFVLAVKPIPTSPPDW